MRISDWSSDVCSSDLPPACCSARTCSAAPKRCSSTMPDHSAKPAIRLSGVHKGYRLYDSLSEQALDVLGFSRIRFWRQVRSEEHTSELQSLMRISYAVLFLKKK